MNSTETELDAHAAAPATPDERDLFPDVEGWKPIDPASMPQGDPQVGVAAELQYLIRSVGERDGWGVLVSVNEDESYAEIDLDIPPSLPIRTLGTLLAVRHIRVPFTAEDREAQEWHGSPDSWSETSAFVSQVGEAQYRARQAVMEAAFEHIRGLLADDARAACSLQVIRTALSN